MCPFHTLGICGVLDANTGLGLEVFVCRTGGNACSSGLHAIAIGDVTREEARLAMGELRGHALAEKGRAAVEAKPVLAFRQG